MKTTNNAQETVREQVSKIVLRGSAVIISFVLLSWSVGAQDFWEQVLNGYNYGKKANSGVDIPFVTANAFHVEEATQADNSIEATFEAIEAELTLQVEAYNVAEFVEAELAAEAENWMNSNTEAIEAELTLQVEAYNAAEFAEAELAAETENWMNSYTEINFEAIETLLVLQVQVYNAREFAEAEMVSDIENWLKKNEIFKSDELFPGQQTKLENEGFAL